MDYEKDFESLEFKTEYGSIHYMHHHGSGETIIFLHGLAASTRTWNKFLEYLPDDLDVYLIDLLGHGRSSAPILEYTVNKQVGILKNFMKAQKIENPFLFGHSYGGWVSTLYAKTGKLKGVIIEDSGGLKGFYDEVRGSMSREEYKKKMLDKALSIGANRHVVGNILNDEFGVGQITEKDLRMIRVPALVIWGKADAVIDPKFSRVFSDNIPNSKLAIIEGAKHTPHYTNAKEVAGILIRFIESNK